MAHDVIVGIRAELHIYIVAAMLASVWLSAACSMGCRRTDMGALTDAQLRFISCALNAIGLTRLIAESVVDAPSSRAAVDIDEKCHNTTICVR